MNSMIALSSSAFTPWKRRPSECFADVSIFADRMTSPSRISGVAAVLTANRTSTWVPVFSSRSAISDAPVRLRSAVAGASTG